MMMLGFVALAISAIIVFAAHNCVELQCGARQNKCRLIIVGFSEQSGLVANHYDDND